MTLLETHAVYAVLRLLSFGFPHVFSKHEVVSKFRRQCAYLKEDAQVVFLLPELGDGDRELAPGLTRS